MVKTAKPAEITNELPPDLAASLVINDDILEDAFRRIVAMDIGFTNAMSKELKREMEFDWRGQKTRIIWRDREDARNARNACIRRDFYMNGMHVGALCRVYKLTRVQIWRIINQPLEDQPPAA